MNDCLIGYTGFVGGNLVNTRSFAHLYNSKNFKEMQDKKFGTIICSGLPAEKWKINQNPEADLLNLKELMKALDTVSCDQFILISTVDVFPNGNGHDENYDCASTANHAYGTHRFMFEEFVRKKFPSALILRLPALFGTGLKKNVIFDLIHNNCLHMINPESSFQYYDLADLGLDIELALRSGLKVVNLVTEPIASSEILDRFFPGKSVGEQKANKASYNLKTLHASAFGGPEGYIRNKQTVLQKLAIYLKQAGV